MFSNSLKKILQQISQKPEWEQYRQYCEVQEHWQKIASRKIAQNTQPKFISRQILWIATSSSVWAQELSLQRYSILKKLNPKLTFTLTDIKFSPADWNKLSQDYGSEPIGKKETKIKQLKSTNKDLNQAKELENNHITNDPAVALQEWLEKIQLKANSPTLPHSLCPQCNSLTPLQELERWQVCCHCISNKWLAEYHTLSQNKEE